MGYVTLMGAEDVQRAGHSMRSAAEEMSRAASLFDAAVERHRIILEDFLQRMESILAARKEE